MQLLPAIDLRGGKCVRLRQGDYAQETVFGDDPAEMARRWHREGADRLHLVDLDGAKAGRPVNVEAIRSIVKAVSIPCQLGGGVRDEEGIKSLLGLGLERLIVGTQALKQRAWFEEMSRKYPGRLVLGIDARDSMVATEGWLEVSRTSALDLAKQYAHLPLAALVYTNIANDGMMAGIDNQTIIDMQQLSELGIPVIASGGVTTLADIEKLVTAAKTHPKLSSAIIGRALYEGTIALPEAVRLVKGT